jgi:hypothetical protein
MNMSIQKVYYVGSSTGGRIYVYGEMQGLPWGVCSSGIGTYIYADLLLMRILRGRMV